MLASKLILKCLEKENVDVIFGYPGGALLPLYEAFRESPIEHVLVRNEQAGPHYASGYARETGKVGVCLATSGPGATNMVTGIATAYLDSIPIVAITGQVNRDLIGTDAFQEADIFGATAPFTKHSYLVKEAADLPRIIREAFHIASTGRPGPVLIDIPRDVQLETIKNIKYVDEVDIRGYKPTYEGHMGQIRRAIRKIKASKRPVIYAGGGVVLSKAQAELLTFAQQNTIPVITSLMGIGAFPENHPLYAGIVGSHGYEYSNHIMDEADLCICVGARMSDRGTMNNVGSMNDMELIHIDIDPAEIGKNIDDTNIPIVGDARIVLSDLIEKDINKDTKTWITGIEKIKEEHPVLYDCHLDLDLVNPKLLFTRLSDIAALDATLVADVGLNQIWSALYYHVMGDRHYFTSGGLGTMGYSIPAAAGVAFATRETPKQIFAVCGDGSFQMAMGELGVIAEYQLDVNIILINNGKLGMVRQLQHDNYGKNHYSGTDLSFSVDFMTLAKAYGIQGFHAETTEEAESAIAQAIAHKGPTLVECMVHEDFIRI
ncbi:acetolactate synthase, large subunit [Eubacterium aggregans]|uniref:Acetolactate synthase n=1 Tax=Eubacterium aggregans TaxID=81409 RepID=A0A1H4CUE7_9FIRM|nr:biosynthetic-type acetolactate synthase large subunit [Eubacterium aggregans]SEA63986.1 acetolactate synthase, large subunit [Eubacterium aggregans]